MANNTKLVSNHGIFTVAALMSDDKLQKAMQYADITAMVSCGLPTSAFIKDYEDEVHELIMDMCEAQTKEELAHLYDKVFDMSIRNMFKGDERNQFKELVKAIRTGKKYDTYMPIINTTVDALPDIFGCIMSKTNSQKRTGMDAKQFILDSIDAAKVAIGKKSLDEIKDNAEAKEDKVAEEYDRFKAIFHSFGSSSKKSKNSDSSLLDKLEDASDETIDKIGDAFEAALKEILDDLKSDEDEEKATTEPVEESKVESAKEVKPAAADTRANVKVDLSRFIKRDAKPQTAPVTQQQVPQTQDAEPVQQAKQLPPASPVRSNMYNYDSLDGVLTEDKKKLFLEHFTYDSVKHKGEQVSVDSFIQLISKGKVLKKYRESGIKYPSTGPNFIEIPLDTYPIDTDKFGYTWAFRTKESNKNGEFIVVYMDPDRRHGKNGDYFLMSDLFLPSELDEAIRQGA